MIHRVSRLSPFLALARYVFIESLRNRLCIVLCISLGAIIALCEFTGSLTLTETSETQAGLAAFILRLAAVALTCVLVVCGMAREIHDRNLDLLLSLPLPRFMYYLGKLSGYLLTALLIALLSGLPLLLYADTGRVAMWCASLFCELAMMTALCLFFMSACDHIAVPLSLAAISYLLARTISAMQLISHSSLLDDVAWSQEAARGLLDIVALLLPSLDAFTRTDWLLYGNPIHFAPLLSQTLIYVSFLVAAGLADIYRRNF